MTPFAVDKFDGMTVNERLFEAGLADQFEAAKASNNLKAVNDLLEVVGLWQDENGMNWSINDNAPNQ